MNFSERLITDSSLNSTYLKSQITLHTVGTIYAIDTVCTNSSFLFPEEDTVQMTNSNQEKTNAKETAILHGKISARPPMVSEKEVILSGSFQPENYFNYEIKVNFLNSV